MPYYSRRFSRRRRFYRRRRSWRSKPARFRKRTYKPRTIRARVTALEKNTEKKWHDALFSIFPGTDFVAENIIPPLDQGVGTGSQGDRIGESVNLRHLQMRYTVDAGDNTQTLRMVVVQFPSFNNTPTAAEVFDRPTAVAGQPLPLASFYKKNSDCKFKILHDKYIYCKNTGPETITGNIKLSLPKTGLRLTYERPTDVQPKNNLIKMFLASDSTVIPHPNMLLETRISYTDS